ncbi:hypothetical protein [Streptomyces sp. NBC_00878]|uniref:hypothetical protein n=1 Tax=Streptomyces sp. NBC_00878 TaxID=2975854 RepID=UPI00225B829A|nr:hypothetical protein [Streptomyces sp. NBC_00878]MCX4908635.1 hypothetical protein [Streptomyces sp. NBC_00878]
MTDRQFLAVVDDAMPRIEYRHFQLVDDGASVEAPDGWARSPHMVVAAGHGAILRTGGNDFYPLVRVEVWSAQPDPQDPSLWEVLEEADLRSDSGSLLLREWDGGPVGDPLPIERLGSYRLKAHCRGRAEAEALIGDELYYEGVEEWLLQLWPLDEGDRPE